MGRIKNHVAIHCLKKHLNLFNSQQTFVTLLDHTAVCKLRNLQGLSQVHAAMQVQMYMYMYDSSLGGENRIVGPAEAPDAGELNRGSSAGSLFSWFMGPGSN